MTEKDMSGKYLAGATTAGSQLSSNIHISDRKMNLHKTSISVRNKISLQSVLGVNMVIEE